MPGLCFVMLLMVFVGVFFVPSFCFVMLVSLFVGFLCLVFVLQYYSRCLCFLCLVFVM